MKKIKKILKKIEHKKIWFNSMIGMTWGFIATLIVGTIIGIFGLYSKNNVFISIKNALTFLTPFGIGVGIGIKNKLKPLQIFATSICAFIVSKSLIKPYLKNQEFIFNSIKINLEMKMFIPGDIFAAWLSGVIMLYFFKFYKFETYLDIFLLPIIGILIGVINMFWLTYFTSLITILFEWIILNTINHKLWIGILLAPIFGSIMGLALSLPTSSAAMAFALNLHGDAAIVAIAATAGQMISFGVMTYMLTKNVWKSISIGFGTTMLQMKNFVRKPFLLVIPTLVSALGGMISLSIFSNSLPFYSPSTTSGMGTSGLYGQIFTLKENGWNNTYAWLNVIFIQLLLPSMLTIPLVYLAIKKGLIKNKDLIIEG